jgi:hypothetical protein
LLCNREPFDRQTGEDARKPLDTAGEIFADPRRIAGDHPHRWKFTPQYRDESRLALNRNDAFGRTAGADEALRQTADSGAEFENVAWPRQVDATGDRIGETSATRIGGCDSQRFLQPKGKKDACIRVHAVIPPTQSAALFYQWCVQFYERYMLRASS